MSSELSWLSRLVDPDEIGIKLLGGANLVFSGSEIFVVDGPNLNVIHEFDINGNGAAHYVVYVECGSDHRETMNASVVSINNKAALTVYGRVNTGVGLINLNAELTGSLLQVYATPAIPGLKNIKVTVFATVSETLFETTTKATVYYNLKVNSTPKFTVNTGAYSIDQESPSLTLYRDLVYRFDQSDASNDGNPIVIGTIQDDVVLSVSSSIAYYIDGSVSSTDYRNLSKFNAGSTRYAELTVKSSTPDSLFYFSSGTTNLGNTITVVDYS